MTTYTPDPTGYAAAQRGTVFLRLDRGVVRGTGADRLDLLHRLSTNDTLSLEPGHERSTILTSDKGRIIEVLRVIAFDDHVLMMTLGPDVERVRQWLDKYTIMDDFQTVDASDRYLVLGLYGENARAIASALAGGPPPDAGRVAIVRRESSDLVVMRDMRLGVGGFLLLVPREVESLVVEELKGAGAEEIDRATYETLRVEAGQPSIGHELTDAYNPLEANLVQLVSFTKGCYIGQEVIARLDTYDKVQRHLVGLVLAEGEGELPEGSVARDPMEGKNVGVPTSVVYSPRMGKRIALAYIKTQHAVPGAEVELVRPEGGEPIARATIAKLPFDV